MAGSYNHCVDTSTGKLLVSEQLQGMLECCSADVYEAIEEMYGMIWHLAAQIADEVACNPRDVVEHARKNYKQGLHVSPGVDGLLKEEPDGA